MCAATLEQIETLNAHGPYNHSVWTSGGRTLTHEEALTGRARFLASTLVRVLRGRYSEREMESMSVLDVGCYDGWLLHQISSLPFRRLLGVEPRLKNIRKGETAREVLGIHTRAEFRQGGLENLAGVVQGQTFDVVIAAGLLHHVESPAEALRSLREVCGRLLFLETIVLDSRHLTRRARAEIEPKDVVYFGRSPAAGLSGAKLESSYYDGSATGLRVVNIPSIETIGLCCEAAGFSPPRVEADPDAYGRAAGNGKRPFRAAILTAEPRAPAQDTGRGQDYERMLASVRIPRPDLEPLHRRYCRDERRVAHTMVSRAVSRMISGRGGASLPRSLPAGAAEREILQTLPHAPGDKIAVEMGKLLLAEGRLAEAETEFRSITGRWNADWRSVYRAFHYLIAIADRKGDAPMSRRYSSLLAAANPHFPEDAWPRGAGNGITTRDPGITASSAPFHLPPTAAALPTGCR